MQSEELTQFAKTFKEKFEPSDGYDRFYGYSYGYQYLYIITERGESDYCKIGKTNQKLYERLRKLQQGNPRKLEITHLYAGRHAVVDAVELSIKQNIGFYQRCLGGTEWIRMPADLLDESIQRNLPNSMLKITNPKLVPYERTSYARCYLHRNNLDVRDVLLLEWENLTNK